MKIIEVVFIGFTQQDYKEIQNEMNRQEISPEDEFFLGFTQLVADVIGCDVGTLIQPGGSMAIVKIGG